jgi:hypothetical protein
MIELKEIDRCYSSCPFFGNSMDGMECRHPFWDNKPAYENMIITHDNSKNGDIPEKCPLKYDFLIVNYKLKCK